MAKFALALLGLLLLVPWEVAGSAEAEAARPKRKLDVWYVPTPHEVVDRMLDVSPRFRCCDMWIVHPGSLHY